MRHSTSFAAALVLATASPMAWGHAGEVQAGKQPYFVDGSLVGGGSTWGIVLPAGERYARVCEEAYSYPAVLTASYSHLRSDGDVLIGGFAGTFVARDEGCTYEPVSGIPGDGKTSAFARLADGRLLAASATADLSGPNGLYESVDEGSTWTVALAPEANVAIFQIVTNDDGTRVVATGNRRDPVAQATTPLVLVSEDAGATFTDVSAAYADISILRATGFAPDGTTALFGGVKQVDGASRGIVRTAAPPYDAPLFVGDLDSEVTHVAVLGETLLALLKQPGLLFAKVGVGEFALATTIANGPTDCVFVHPAGDRFIGCGKEGFESLGMFMESTDGLTWTPLIGFDDVGYRRCPADTQGAIACAGQFESSCEDLLDEDFDQLVDCDDPDCADVCVGGPGEGEGEGPAEGEGEVGSEGEGEEPVQEPSCTGARAPAELGAALVALALVARRRRRS